LKAKVEVCKASAESAINNIQLLDCRRIKNDIKGFQGQRNARSGTAGPSANVSMATNCTIHSSKAGKASRGILHGEFGLIMHLKQLQTAPNHRLAQHSKKIRITAAGISLNPIMLN